MRARALDALTRASAKLDTYRVETAESGAVIRGALRRDPLDGLRAQGRRLATLTKTSDAGLKYDDAIARVDALDRTLGLEIDGSDRALAAAATDLDAAQGALRTLVAVGGEGARWCSFAAVTVPPVPAAAPTGAAAGRSTRRASTSRGRTWRRGRVCKNENVIVTQICGGETRSRAPDAQLA